MRAGRGHNIYPVKTFTIVFEKSLEAGHFLIVSIPLRYRMKIHWDIFLSRFFYLFYLYDIKPKITGPNSFVKYLYDSRTIITESYQCYFEYNFEPSQTPKGIDITISSKISLKYTIMGQ